MIRCKKCGKRFLVYDRSFYGVGKKCPGCEFVHHPAVNEEVPTFEAY